jgi:dTDP-4-dehydrorhamnose 3,5-epimerase-like enzyme
MITIGDLQSLDIQVFTKKTFSDSRGYMQIIFEGSPRIVDSHFSMKRSFSFSGVGRGLHHQNVNSPQTKVITVTSGKLLDFIYDPSLDSNLVHCFYINSSDNCSIVIPSNYAHGFIALTNVEFEYACIGRYNEANEATYNILRSAAQLLQLGDVNLSAKDSSSPPIEVSL